MATGDIYRLLNRTLYQPLPGTSEFGWRLDNVFHFRARDGSATALGLAEDWRDNPMQVWRDQVYDNVLFAHIYVYSMIPDGPAPVHLTTTHRGTRTAADQLIAPLCCAEVIQWNFRDPDMRRRGQSFFRAVEYRNLPYSIGGGSGAGGQAVADALMSRYGPDTPSPYEFIVWSPTNGGRQPPYNPAGATPVEEWDNSQWMGVRKGRVGRNAHEYRPQDG